MSLLTAYWRFRAEEVRAIADEMKHTDSKLTLARVAEDYERIARLFENGTLKLQTSPVGRTGQNGDSGRGSVQNREVRIANLPDAVKTAINH
jgi:hypothetical protein